VRSWLEGNFRFGLSGTEVQMVKIVGNGAIERRKLCVNQQVMVTRICAIQAGGRNSHVMQAEADGHLCRKTCAIIETDEINPGPFGRGRRTASSALLR
jgi:hypothetical protein